MVFLKSVRESCKTMNISNKADIRIISIVSQYFPILMTKFAATVLHLHPAQLRHNDTEQHTCGAVVMSAMIYCTSAVAHFVQNTHTLTDC